LQLATPGEIDCAPPKPYVVVAGRSESAKEQKKHREVQDTDETPMVPFELKATSRSSEWENRMRRMYVTGFARNASTKIKMLFENGVKFPRYAIANVDREAPEVIEILVHEEFVQTFRAKVAEMNGNGVIVLDSDLSSKLVKNFELMQDMMRDDVLNWLTMRKYYWTQSSGQVSKGCW
jgi:hypothetical protein